MSDVVDCIQGCSTKMGFRSNVEKHKSCSSPHIIISHCDGLLAAPFDTLLSVGLAWRAIKEESSGCCQASERFIQARIISYAHMLRDVRILLFGAYTSAGISKRNFCDYQASCCQQKSFATLISSEQSSQLAAATSIFSILLIIFLQHHHDKSSEAWDLKIAYSVKTLYTFYLLVEFYTSICLLMHIENSTTSVLGVVFWY